MYNILLLSLHYSGTELFLIKMTKTHTSISTFLNQYTTGIFHSVASNSIDENQSHAKRMGLARQTYGFGMVFID